MKLPASILPKPAKLPLGLSPLLFTCVILAVYTGLLWIGIQWIGTQMILTGYLAAGFIAWHLGVKRGILASLAAIAFTMILLRFSVDFATQNSPQKALFGTVFFVLTSLAAGWVGEMTRKLQNTQHLLEAEYAKSEMLLKNILPESIAKRLKAGEVLIADKYAETTILFCDIVGFTELTKTMTPESLIQLLNRIVSAFDSKAEELGIEKIKTIGDAYLVVAGLPESRDDHARIMCSMAFQMQEVIADINHSQDMALQLRMGMHSGPVIGGVIGQNKFTFDMWGDTVNLASRLESHGMPGRINISEQTYLLIKDHCQCIPAGITSIKSYGDRQTWHIEISNPIA